jgi:hypothetical protein
MDSFVHDFQAAGGSMVILAKDPAPLARPDKGGCASRGAGAISGDVWRGVREPRQAGDCVCSIAP